MPESKLFWNVSVVFERVLIRNQGAFPDILLKRIDTIRLVGGIAKILSLLLQTYNSWRDKEIDRTERLSIILSRKGTKPFSISILYY